MLKCFFFVCNGHTESSCTIDYMRSVFASVSSDPTKRYLQSCLSKMTEAAPNQFPLGYDEGFVTVVEEDFQCLICHLPLKGPHGC